MMKTGDWIPFILLKCKSSAHIKVNDLDYIVKPDDTLKARQRGIQLVSSLASECCFKN